MIFLFCKATMLSTEKFSMAPSTSKWQISAKATFKTSKLKTPNQCLTRGKTFFKQKNWKTYSYWKEKKVCAHTCCSINLSRKPFHCCIISRRKVLIKTLITVHYILTPRQKFPLHHWKYLLTKTWFWQVTEVECLGFSNVKVSFRRTVTQLILQWQASIINCFCDIYYCDGVDLTGVSTVKLFKNYFKLHLLLLNTFIVKVFNTEGWLNNFKMCWIY